MRQKKTFLGMTLMETMLYLGIAVFVMGALFSYGWNMAGISVKSSVIQETAAAAQSIDQAITGEIRQAASVDQDNSVFVGNPAKLVLKETDGSEVTIVAADGQVTLQRGGSDTAALHSSEIRADNFMFTVQNSVAGDAEYVGFSFEAVAAYPGSVKQSSYQYSLPVRSGASLRNH